jgi:hypothetical protein
MRGDLGAFYASAAAVEVELDPVGDGEVNRTAGAWRQASGVPFGLAAHLMQRLSADEAFEGGWVEYQLSAARTVGRASAGLTPNYSPDADGPAREAWWNQASAGWRLTDPDQVSAAVAERRAQGGGDHATWNIGIARRTAQGFVFDLHPHDTDKHEFGSEFDRRVVAALFRTF